jgi:hypothetical protein
VTGFSEDKGRWRLASVAIYRRGWDRYFWPQLALSPLDFTGRWSTYAKALP